MFKHVSGFAPPSNVCDTCIHQQVASYRHGIEPTAEILSHLVVHWLDSKESENDWCTCSASDSETGYEGNCSGCSVYQMKISFSTKEHAIRTSVQKIVLDTTTSGWYFIEYECHDKDYDCDKNVRIPVQNGKVHGLCTIYSDSRRKLDIPFFDGKIDGTVTEDRLLGRKNPLWKRQFTNGVLKTYGASTKSATKRG